MTTKLSEPEIRSALGGLSGWTVLGGKLHREYKFADFVHAFDFMTSGALAAEAMGHHPEWFNVYNRLTVDLTTHDAGGINEKDTELAGKLNALYSAVEPEKTQTGQSQPDAAGIGAQTGGKFSG
jgi:4a-hydroxytetrahydrobiopterin dehydratase